MRTLRKELHRRAWALLFALLMPLAASATFVDGGKRTFPLSCNGVPCVADTAGKALYCSVSVLEGDSMKVVFTSSSVPFLRINYHRYNMGDTVTLVRNFNRSYRIYIGNSLERWTLWFSPLPLVMVEASSYEHDVFHHGYIYVIDPLRRTNHLPLFTHFIGMRIRGGYTSGLAKKPYAVKLWDGSRQGKNISVLGLAKDDNLILDAMYNDKARMRNRLCTDLWNAVDSIPYEVSTGHSRLNGTQGLYVEVFLEGKYNGLYCLTDKINRRKLDLEKTERNDDGTVKAQRGMLYKSSGWSDETRFKNVDYSANTIATLAWKEWEQKYPDDSKTDANWKPLSDLIAFTAKNTNPNSYNFNAYLRQRYYLQNIVDYALFVNVLHLVDNVCKNLYVSFRDVGTGTRKALFTPWDLDASFGRSWDGKKLDSFGFNDQMLYPDIIGRPIKKGPYYYRTLLHDTWIRWKKGPFSVDSVKARIHAFTTLLLTSGARTRESQRWPSSMENVITEQNYMISWYERSVARADSFLSGYPTAVEGVGISESHIAVSNRGGHISVEGGGEVAEISVFSSDGCLISRVRSALPWQSGVLPAGIYVVRVNTPSAVVSRKTVIR